MASSMDLKSFNKMKWYSQVLVVVIICGLLLGLVWYQFLSPMQTDIAARQSQLAELQAQIAKSIQQQLRFAQFKKETEELEAKLESLKSVLPLEKETDQILRLVQQSATNSALRILRIGPKATVDHEVYTEWPIDMEVVGTYHNIGAFLDKIRQLPRIVNISNMKIQARTPDGAISATVGATYTATTFVYKEEQIATTAPPAKPIK